MNPDLPVRSQLGVTRLSCLTKANWDCPNRNNMLQDFRFSQRYLRMLPSSGLCSVIPMWTDASEERITSICRVQNQPNKKPACSRWLGHTSYGMDHAVSNVKAWHWPFYLTNLNIFSAITCFSIYWVKMHFFLHRHIFVIHSYLPGTSLSTKPIFHFHLKNVEPSFRNWQLRSWKGNAFYFIETKRLFSKT
jgi:hypothetical protein